MATFFIFNAFNTIAAFSFFIVVHYLFSGNAEAAGVWPTVFAVTSLGGRWLLSGWPFWLAVGIETMVVVAILTWGVMPLLTRWLRSWLSSSAGSVT